ncbi:MAG: hypothetical protein IPN17_25255 [Deltaproteobacteria bacterium]|nr:hypothetical protein [Deltaproteobacteria bacterium]
MIAAWWGDVDTRNRVITPDTRNRVYYALERTGATRPEGGISTGRFIATWHYVGYYSNANDRLNDFQIVLTNRSDIVAGDYDVEIRYNQCQWTTGTSGGTGGLGDARPGGLRRRRTAWTSLRAARLADRRGAQPVHHVQRGSADARALALQHPDRAA